VPSTIFAPSIVYSPHDYWVGLMERLTWLPAVPISGSGRAPYQPIWAENVVDCVIAAIDRGDEACGRYELAGPETLTYDDVARTVLRSLGRRRRLVHVPLPVVRSSLKAVQAVMGAASPAVWDEVELMEARMTTRRGTEDARSLGVSPLPMREVLGAR
jgi:NADH dehydrogenase